MNRRFIQSVMICFLAMSLGRGLLAQDGNRLTYLDHPCDLYYVGRDFPKLTTPQWIGEEDVDCVVVLAIDDMREPAQYEQYLRPILERLKQIDGRAPVSIMTNSVDPADPQLTAWLEEGLSIDAHTIDHPCPCLHGANFDQAKSTYDRCVDMLADIPGNRPVAFRMPCCDSMNSPSPRFYTEIFNRTTPNGRFLTIDSSVFQIYTPADEELPAELLYDDDGGLRFRKYLPFPSFVNTIENYPYPYLIGRLGWQFPCMVPSDWEGQHLHQPNNPKTLEDLKVALDLTVSKQGVFTMVFHPHGWIRSDQVVELIDHAVTQYGGRVKFLTFAEAQQRVDEFLLAGNPVRNSRGEDNGVRLLDVNGDGYQDVVIGNDESRKMRVWQPESQSWREVEFPGQIVTTDHDSGSPVDCQVRFGMDTDDRVICLTVHDGRLRCYRFDEAGWQQVDAWERGLGEVLAFVDDTLGPVSRIRLMDVDDDGVSELIGENDTASRVWQYNPAEGWQPTGWGLPEIAALTTDAGGDSGTRFFDVDQDGALDVVVSNESGFGLFLFESMEEGWANTVRQGARSDERAIPMISRGGTNNGAWFHSDHLWVQNEDTNRLPDNVDRLSLEEMLRTDEEAAAIKEGTSLPLSPEASLDKMQAATGFRVELMAAEPLVMDPVAFDWGADGKLWVVEMADYPLGIDDQGKPGGRVRYLEDTDGDGRYDRSTLFLEGLNFPNGVMAWRDGVIVSAAPKIFYAEDTDGDGSADRIETLYEGFVEGNQQHRVNGFWRGLDNWIYVANGDSGGTIRSTQTGERVEIGGRDLRIRPDEGLIDAQTGQSQFGRCRDDWGNWFGCSNSYPVYHFMLADHYLRRNPHVVTPEIHNFICTVDNTPIYPIGPVVSHWEGYTPPTPGEPSRFTSACGVTIYRDDLYGDPFLGNAFVSEPIHNLVHRHVLSSRGVTFDGHRAEDEQESEFLASEDPWFRPCGMRVGPDGAIWVADMYRFIIEHPEWIDDEEEQRLDLRMGHDRGRIYRVVPTDRAPRSIPNLEQLSTEELVAALDSPSGWQRDMIQQLLVWRGDEAAIVPLERLAATSDRPLARLHALCTLDGLDSLDVELLERAICDPHPGVCRHAVRLCENRVMESELINETLLQLNAEDPMVALQLAYTLGFVDDPRAASKLMEICRQHADDSLVVAAAMSSLNAGNIVRCVLEYSSDTTDLSDDIWKSLSGTLAGLGKTEAVPEIVRSLSDAAGDRSEADRLNAAAVLIGVLDEEALRDTRLQDPLSTLGDTAEQILRQEESAADARIAAIRFVGALPGNDQRWLSLLQTQIGATKAQEIQLAALAAIFRVERSAAMETVLSSWNQMTPSIRNEAVDLSLQWTSQTVALLDAIAAGNVSPTVLTFARIQRLRNYDDREVIARLDRIARSEITSDRAELVHQWQENFDDNGIAAHGRQVFQRACANCHQLSGIGKSIGPDLAALTDKSSAALLTAILDPNRAVEDKYVDYIVITLDGRQFSGMLVQESGASLVLATSEGKLVEFPRAEIDVIQSSGKSLMPEGMERDITREDMAHLLAFVQTVAPPHKSFPNNEPAVVQQQDDGLMNLSANRARIYGPSLVFEQRFGNLGFWSSPEDWAAWDIEVAAGGAFEVTLDYAVHPGAAGDQFVLTIDGQTVEGTVESTGDWDEYTRTSFGQVRLTAGHHVLTVRSAGPIRAAMIDLRTVELTPAVDARAEGGESSEIAMPQRGICAHRGAIFSHPENTLTAFEEAIRLGVHQIEFDVYLTRDKQLVVIHDATVDRTTDGTGEVTQMTLAEIRRLDAGSWKDERFAGERVPTLRETLDMMPVNIWLNVHLKGDAELGAAVAQEIVRQNRGHQSFLAANRAAAEAAHSVDPEILICNMELQGRDSRYVNDTLAHDDDFIQLNGGAASAENMARLESAGVVVNYCCTNNPRELEPLFNAGVAFPLVDDVSEMMKAAASLGIDPWEPVYRDDSEDE